MGEGKTYTRKEMDDAIVDVASNYGALREAIAKLEGFVYEGGPTELRYIISQYKTASDAISALLELAPSGMTKTDPESLRGRLKIRGLEDSLSYISSRKIRISTEPEEGEN